MTAKNDTLLARINELEQMLNNERTVGREKWQEELANDAFNHFKRQEILNEMRIKNYIEQWKPRGE